MNNETRFDSIEDGIKAIARGEMVICVDDEDRENEGDLICSAEKITPEMVNFMDALNGVILMENLAMNFSEYGKRGQKIRKYLSDRLEISKKELVKKSIGPQDFSFNQSH